MTDINLLQLALKDFAGMDESTFQLSAPYWQQKTYRKGECYNEYKQVCKHLGFVTEGLFRTYYIDEKTSEGKNVFFFSKHQVIVALTSFLSQIPCNYYTESMAESRILYIHIDHLTTLYKQSHAWEHFGRLIAEQGFLMAMNRTESFLFQTPEERYLNLVKQHPDIFEAVPLYHISSYLGIKGPSLSRIRKRISIK